jgi:hypothetical protein
MVRLLFSSRRGGRIIERLADIGAAAVFLEQVAEGLLGDLGQILHLLARQEVDGVPGGAVEWDALANEIGGDLLFYICLALALLRHLAPR